MYLICCIVEDGAKNIDCSIPGAQLSSIRYRDIAAVVREVDEKIAEELGFSKIPLDPPLGKGEFEEQLGKGNLEEQLKNWLAAYQQANIDIFNHFTMLPLRFGTAVDHKGEIEDFLSASYIHLKWALDKLRGKAEFVVQVFWDLNMVLQDIVQDKQYLHQIHGLNNVAEATGASANGSLQNRIELGRLLFQIANVKKKEIIESVHRKLFSVSLDSSEGRYADETDKDVCLTIMNRSYLIEKSAEGSFDKAMAELGAEGKSYLSFKYVGPMPPYSFAPLEFERGNFELIDEARRMFMLPEQARFDEIKASYRRLSLKYHPDKNPGDQQSAERFREINEAYKILEMYCSSYGGSLDSGEAYSFTKDDVEEVFVAGKKVISYSS